MKILTPNGKYLFLDQKDVHLLLKYHLNFSTRYVTAWDKEKKKTIMLHRIILNAQKGQMIDHINRNKLDNRRKNLRFTTYSQNMHNRGLFKVNSTGLTGVCFNKMKNTYTAQIKINKKSMHLGSFKNKVDARKAYELASMKYYGEFVGLS